MRKKIPAIIANPQPSTLKRLDRCPLNDYCKGTKLYQDSEGKVYVFNGAYDLWNNHVCTVKNSVVSYSPEKVYQGVWFNKRTGRTRYTGPYRDPKSCEKPPVTNSSSSRKNPLRFDEWELKEIQEATTEWNLFKRS